MPITLTGRTALSVEMPITVSTGKCRSRTARTIFSGPQILVETASNGKYSQVGTCFGAAQGSCDSVKIAHIANPELEQPREILIDNLVGRRAAMQVFDPQRVLLCLIAREDDDLGDRAGTPA